MYVKYNDCSGCEYSGGTCTCENDYKRVNDAIAHAIYENDVMSILQMTINVKCNLYRPKHFKK